ncbi:MAG: phosphotransferase [Pseudomonadota bacterium]
MSSSEIPVDWQGLISEYELEDAKPHLIGEGWCSRCYRLTNDVVVKIPKASDGWLEVWKEARTVDFIAQDIDDVRLPTPIVGSANQFSPNGFFAARFVDGVPWGSTGNNDASGLAVAQTLGRSLRRIHGLTPTSELSRLLPHDDHVTEYAGLEDEAMRRIRHRLGASFMNTVSMEVNRIVRSDHMTNFAPSLVHADLSSEHILVSASETPAVGIIDWGDAAMGDPDRDFLHLWLDFGEVFLQECLTAYGHSSAAGELIPKLRDMELLGTLYEIVYAGEHGLPGDEDGSWDDLEDWFSR